MHNGHCGHCATRALFNSTHYTLPYNTAAAGINTERKRQENIVDVSSSRNSNRSLRFFAFFALFAVSEEISTGTRF